MPNLNGVAPASTFYRLVQFGNAGNSGISTTPVFLQDGSGNNLPIRVATTGTAFSGFLYVSTLYGEDGLFTSSLQSPVVTGPGGVSSSVDLLFCNLTDNNGEDSVTSVDWNNRQLHNSGDTAITLDWNNNILSGAWDCGGLQINASGTNISRAVYGSGTLVAGRLAVSAPTFTNLTKIFPSQQFSGGAPGFLNIIQRVAGSGFRIGSSSATDTSVVAWQLIDN